MSSFTGEEGFQNRLPVLFNDKDLGKYPEFKKLLKALTEYIEEHGTSKDVKSEFDDCLDSLRQEKLRYLQVKVIYQEVKDALLDEEIDNVDHVSDDHSAELCKTMKEALTAAEVSGHLDFNPEVSGSDVSLLGLKAESLQSIDANKTTLQQGLIPELEKRLKTKCEHLAQHHQTSKVQGKDSKFAFGKATQLPSTIEGEKLSLEENKKLLGQSTMKRGTQYAQYYQTLVHSLEVLDKLISQHKLEWQKKYDEITSHWLTAKCRAMCFKIRVLQNQLLCDTYTPEAIAALKQIRESLQSKENETKQELHRVMQAFQAYRSVGMGFDSLVRLYGDLLAEIDNKKWALTELRHNESQDLIDLWK